MIAKQEHFFRRNLSSLARNGNAMSEYAVLAGVMVVGSIGVLLLFSGDLRAEIDKVKGDASNHAQTASNVSLTIQSRAWYGKLGLLTEEDAKLLQTDLETRLQTIGANGTTLMLAQQIATVAQRLKDEGKISETQYAELMALANQGHKMAAIQEKLAVAVDMAGGDFQKFSEVKFMVDGKEYTAPDLYNLIGFMGPTPQSAELKDPLLNGDTGEPDSNQLLTLYKAALASGALNDPEAKSTVDSAATQILQIGEGVENRLSEFYHGNSLQNNDDLNLAASRSATDMESAKICKAGDYVDDGVTCQK